MKNSIYLACKEFFLNIIFPRKCVGCGQEGAWICEGCRAKIVMVKSPTCPICHKLTKNGHFCSRHRRGKALTGIISVAYLDQGPLKELIHYFKYRNIRELTDFLAELMMERLKLGFPYGDLLIVPVPLHPARQAMRGYNQAELLANKIGEYYDIESANDLVRRIKNNKPQVELKAKERWQNVQGVFNLCQGIERIKGKTVLLVDDITTTGATLNEIGRLLRKKGARQIWGLVMAKG